MSVYHLSYDVKDSDKTDNNEFRCRITKGIIKSFNPKWIYRPVASTLFFTCTNDMSIVGPKVKQLMDKESFYILTETKIDEKNYAVLEWAADQALEKSFNKECEQIKRELSNNME